MQPSRIAIIGADWPEYELYCPNFTGMTKGLEELGIEHRLFGCRPDLDIQAVIDFNPDLVVYGLVDLVRQRAVRLHLREALPNAKIVMWYGDLREARTGGQIHADMSEIDAMFVSNDAQADYYRERWKVPSVHFLPLGCQIYTPTYNPKFDFDFVFIGGLITGAGFLDRARMMWKFKDNGLKVVDGPMRRPILRAKVMKNMPQIYRSSKVVLDVSHFTDVPGYTSNRYWIITASGGFALTKRFPGCEEFYPPGTRAYFDTFEEALSLRDYYLANPEEREKIRLAGYAHAIHHTYRERFVKMFETLYGASNENRLRLKSVQTPGASKPKRPPILSPVQARKGSHGKGKRIVDRTKNK